MSCFSLPKWLIYRIDRIRRHFLWSRPNTVTPVHLLNWQAAQIPIANGGLGIPNLQLQNIALLLRWLWRLYSGDRTLWPSYATLIYSAQQPDHIPLIFKTNGSFFWKTLMKIKPIFHSSVRLLLASGLQTSFWHDPWAGQPLHLTHPHPLPHKWISVAQAKNCFHSLIPGPLSLQQSEAHNRLQSFLPLLGPDILSWRLSESGRFSVSSIYTLLSQAGKIKSSVHSIWKARVTPSMRLFCYFLLHNKLLTHEVMTKRNINHTPGCIMCSQGLTESTMHLFFLCPYAHSVWITVSTSLGFSVPYIRDSPMLTYLSSVPPSNDARPSWLVFFITTAYHIWRERNARTFTNKSAPASILVPNITQDAALLLRHC